MPQVRLAPILALLLAVALAGCVSPVDALDAGALASEFEEDIRACEAVYRDETIAVRGVAYELDTIPNTRMGNEEDSPLIVVRGMEATDVLCAGPAGYDPGLGDIDTAPQEVVVRGTVFYRNQMPRITDVHLLECTIIER